MFCAGVKEFLSKNSVQFVERDVTRDKEALSELEKLGVMTTPVILIDGDVVVGYDVSKLCSLLST